MRINKKWTKIILYSIISLLLVCVGIVVLCIVQMKYEYKSSMIIWDVDYVTEISVDKTGTLYFFTNTSVNLDLKGITGECTIVNKNENQDKKGRDPRLVVNITKCGVFQLIANKKAKVELVSNYMVHLHNKYSNLFRYIFITMFCLLLVLIYVLLNVILKRRND